MRKPTKSKKEKVPKITEAEYVEYISHLREGNEEELKMQKGGLIENVIKEKWANGGEKPPFCVEMNFVVIGKRKGEKDEGKGQKNFFWKNEIFL